jgi:hypothetical protein
MKLNRQLYLVAAVALASGCGDLDFDIDLSQSSESPVQVSRQVEKTVPPKDAEPRQPIKAPTENPIENPGVIAPEIVQPAPAPVTPGAGDPPKDTGTPKPVATPVEPEVQPITEEPKEPEDVTLLKLISDDTQQNLEALNMALERWIVAKGILPERLEQLVMEEYLPMLPMEPVGKKFTIDRKNKIIILVRQ